MIDLFGELNREAQRLEAAPNALEITRKRVETRRRNRRAIVGVCALAIAAAGTGLAWSAFNGEKPSVPVAPPTISPAPTLRVYPREHPLHLEVANSTGVTGPISLFATTDIGLNAGFTDRKGYDVRPVGDVFYSREPTLTTRIHYRPKYGAEAARLQELVFPGAELRSLPTGDVDIRVVLGEDYLANQPQFKPYVILDEFMEARLAGTGADSFLSQEALGQFQQGAGGLSLYGYLEGARFELGGFRSSSRYLRADVDIYAPRQSGPSTKPDKPKASERIVIDKGYAAGQTSDLKALVVVSAQRTA